MYSTWYELAVSGSDDAHTLVEMIFEEMHTGQFILIDETLSLIDPTQLSVVGVVAISRSLFPRRTELTNYASFIASSCQHLSDIGEDVTGIMQGLITPTYPV